jgi:hypothetical protein
MKNIHLLPTEKQSRLSRDKNNRNLFINTSKDFLFNAENLEYLNICITNDEEIKEGDWLYVKTPNIYGGNVIAKSLGNSNGCWADYILTETTDEKGYHPSHCKKIILTTDQSLEGVQAISDEFLEWFVKNPSCEEVEVQKWFDGLDFLEYKIIIPKEESKFVTVDIESALGEDLGKVSYIPLSGVDYVPQEEPKEEPIQETLEEAAERFFPNKMSDYEIFLLGAKWQKKRTFSFNSNFIPLIIEKYLETAFISKEQGYMNPKEWFEQYKKK